MSLVALASLRHSSARLTPPLGRPIGSRSMAGKDRSQRRRISPARNPRLVDTVHERPSLRPLAPLLGVLAAMWLGAAGVIAQQLV
jgi:hypothetical protein